MAALGLASGGVVTERKAELLLDEGRHPDADVIEDPLLEAAESPTGTWNASVCCS
jgi:hypothetical protein